MEFKLSTMQADCNSSLFIAPIEKQPDKVCSRIVEFIATQPGGRHYLSRILICNHLAADFIAAGL
jgi:hypothetical protein